MHAKTEVPLSYDRWLLLSAISLLAIGLVMVGSASLSYAEGMQLPIWYFASRHVIYVAIGVLACVLATYIPLSFWRGLSLPLLLLNFFLLAILLIPGVSREVNGSVRWLFLGPVSIQISEITKLTLIIYMANYLVRQNREIQTEIAAFLKPMVILAMISALLLLEPDFGAAVVIISTTLGMLFLGGVPIRRFLVLFLIALGAMGVLLFISPYRVQRLTSFLNPWDDQFKSGYQLTQSLIAFGRGGWFGTGLGNSIQKLLYLPEPHTDFIYAVLAEELGLVGAITILLLFSILVWRTFVLGNRAIAQGKIFPAYVAYGVALWFGLQTLINIGVNVGVLPTKGLTLPLISYGGSSLIIALFTIGILLRIEFELSHKPAKANRLER